MRRDIPGFWNDETWLDFLHAVEVVSDKLTIPFGPALTRLQKLCATGEIRAVVSEDEYAQMFEGPNSIPPSQWREEEFDLSLVAVSQSDLYQWLDQQPVQPIAGGKQSRVARLLAEMFPTGVPSRADRPREPLRADLLARDPSLAPLDLKTLKTAIEAYNRQVGNTRNASVSD